MNEVLSYAQSSLILTNNSAIGNVELTVSPESTLYTLLATEDSQSKTVVLSVDNSSQAIQLVDFNIVPQTITYPPKLLSIPIDVATNQPLVDSALSAIQGSNITAIESVKDVQSITQIQYNPDRYLFNVVNSEDIIYLIILENAVSGFTIITVVPEQTSSPQDTGAITV